MPAGRFLAAGGTDGCPADLAGSTAEGVVGFGKIHENRTIADVILKA